jgi:peptidoglycan/LPS O-acetylase OafA/YrhL
VYPVLTGGEGIAFSRQESSHRPEIDGLRALAVAAVVLNHFNKNLLPSGYLGVDCFFVISGFVITSSLARRPGKHASDFFLGFYTRRIKRLVPALVSCVLLTGLLICLVQPNPSVSLITGITSLFGLSNLYLYKRSTDYFAASSELNAFTQTWSLGIEEQFYLIFPPLVWLSGFGRQTPNGVRNLFRVLVALSIASLLGFIYLNRSDQPASYFLIHARFWELGCGCLMFLGLEGALRNFDSLLARLGPTPVVCALVLVLFAPSRFSVGATIAEVVLTALLLASLRAETAAYDLLISRPMVYVGRISYSLYLWHWTVLSISRWTVGIHWWSAPIQAGLMLLLAAGSYRFIERPLRHAEWSGVRWRSMAYGFAASIIAAICLVGLMRPLQGRLYLGGRLAAKSNALAPLAADDWKRLDEACNMTPQYLSGPGYRPKPLVDRNFLSRCIQSPPEAPQNKMLLVGDSFADISAHHLSIIARRLGYDFRMIFGYGCPFPLQFAAIRSRAMEQCPEVDDDLLRREIIRGLNGGDILVLRLYTPKSQYLSYAAGMPPADAYDQAIADLHRAVSERGAKLMMIGANPTLNPDQVAAMNSPWAKSGDASSIHINNNDETAFYFANDAHLQKVFAGTRGYGVDFFSVKSYLCNSSGVCPLRTGTNALYADVQHITWYAFDLFVEDLFLRMKALAGSG